MVRNRNCVFADAAIILVIIAWDEFDLNLGTELYLLCWHFWWRGRWILCFHRWRTFLNVNNIPTIVVITFGDGDIRHLVLQYPLVPEEGEAVRGSDREGTIHDNSEDIHPVWTQGPESLEYVDNLWLWNSVRQVSVGVKVWFFECIGSFLKEQK